MIRNAVAHDSIAAHEKFEAVARNRLGTVPPNLTVGGFLSQVVPSSSPPESFFEFYVRRIEAGASKIVPH
jgi:hypothetical protein